MDDKSVRDHFEGKYPKFGNGGRYRGTFEQVWSEGTGQQLSQFFPRAVSAEKGGDLSMGTAACVSCWQGAQF